MGKRAGVAGKALPELAAAAVRAVAERVASSGFVGPAAEVLEVGSAKVPFVGITAGSKLRGRVTCLSQCSFKISMFAVGSATCCAKPGTGARHSRSIQICCRAKRHFPSQCIAKTSERYGVGRAFSHINFASLSRTA